MRIEVDMKVENEVFLEKIRNDFSQKRVIVIGDLMVDEYITGKVKRISPEAPVPVLDFRKRSLEAGGACNVAHNMASLGAKVRIVGVAADDEAGRWLRKHFTSMGIEVDGIIEQNGKPTTIKTRYATKGQQLLRVDNEDASGITESTQEKIYDYLYKQIDSLDVVVLSDYRKGVLNDKYFVQKITNLCNEHKVLIAIDSKSRNISAFKNMDFVKPNNLELEEAVGIRIEDEGSLNLAGKTYLEKSGAKALIVTRGSAGISVFIPGKERSDYPAKDVQVYDVCGAGDTVISTVALSIASGINIGEAVQLANLAAGVVISKVGTVAITAEELLRSVIEN